MNELKEYDYFSSDFETFEAELEELDKEQVLRIEINDELDNALKELESLQAQLPKEQMGNLLEQCKDNVIDTITNQFGLMGVMLNAKDGGNVHTTNNVRQGVYANDKERQKYENRGEYDSTSYHQDKAYIEINRKQSALKKEGKAVDYMTGKSINPNDSVDLDHIVSAKNIHDDGARVLAGVEGERLANVESNLALTDSSLNRAKGAKSAEEFLKRRDKRLEDINAMKEKRGLTDSEKNELVKLNKQREINDEEFKKKAKEEQKRIDREIDKNYYTSSKPYKELAITGAKDAANVAVYSAIGIVLRDFVSGMAIELKEIFRQWGNESLKDIAIRFKSRLGKIWEELKVKWKDIIKGSFEAGICAFFSNLVVFVINIFIKTIKKVVQIIRAGFGSLWQAVKILADNTKPIGERMQAAAKVFATGLITSLALLSSEAISNFLKTIPGLNMILSIPIPFSDSTLGEALSLSISGAIGAVLSTIAMYYIDKWANQSKYDKLQIQIMAKSGEVLHYRIQQSYFALADSYKFLSFAFSDTKDKLNSAKATIFNSSNSVSNGLKELAKSMDKLDELDSLLHYQRSKNGK